MKIARLTPMSELDRLKLELLAAKARIRKLEAEQRREDGKRWRDVAAELETLLDRQQGGKPWH